MKWGYHTRGRRIDPQTLPRWLRPKLARDQVRDLALAHVVNLDALSRGEADETILWQWMGGALTWQIIAETLRQANPERYTEAAGAMNGQVIVCLAVVERFRATGRVTLDPDQYAMARDAIDWMDALAEVVDQPTAVKAAELAEAAANAMQASSCA